MFRDLDPRSRIVLICAGSSLIALFLLSATVITVAALLAPGMTPPGNMPMVGIAKAKMAMAYQEKSQNVVAIFPGKSGAEFSVAATKLPARQAIVWVNKTGAAQALVANDNSLTNITIAPGKPFIMVIQNGGRSYSWSLASNPGAQVTVYVGSSQ